MAVLTRWLICFAFLCCPMVVHAATYYVSKSGTVGSAGTCINARSDNCPAGGSCAKLTINAGIACLVAGDTLLVKPGIYAEVLNNVIPSGTAGNHTIVRSETQYGAILRPTSNAQLTAGKSLVTINNRQYITLDGFVSDGINLHKVYHIYLQGTTNNILIQNNEIKNGTSDDQLSNTLGIVDGHGPHHLTIKNNLIHHMGDNAPGTGPGGFPQGFPVPVKGNGIYLHVNDSVIEGNTIHSNATYGIHNYNTDAAHNKRNIIRNNTIYNNGSRGILVTGGDDNLIHHNIVYHSGIYNAPAGGIHVGGFGLPTSNTRVYHNTVWDNNAGCGIQIGGGQPTSSTTIRNNILYQNSTDNVCSTNATGNTINNNLLGTNPLFVNAANGNFTLQPISPGVDAGALLSGFTYVYGQPYMGAIEPVPDDPPPPPPPPPCITPLYVSTAGNDTTNDCTEAGILGTAKRTIAAAMACACTPGTEIVIKGGTYAEQISTVVTPLVPGTSTNVRTTIRAFENAGIPETVILQLPASGGSSSMIQIKAPTDQWLHLKNLQLDGQNRFASHGIVIDGGAKRVLLENLTVHNFGADGVFLGPGAHEIEIRGGEYYSPFHTTAPNIYASSSNSNLIIRDALIRDALGSTKTCVHMRSLATPGGVHSGLLIERTTFKNCETALYIGEGVNARVVNNLFYDNVVAIDVLSGLTGSLFAYNTITSNTLGLRCNTGASTITLQNSILYNNSTDLTNTCNALRLNNLVGIDPVFTNPGTDNYTIQNTSPAIDAALAVVGVTTDFLGASRTLYGVGPDIGAYESTAAPPEPTGEVCPPVRLSSGFFGR